MNERGTIPPCKLATVPFIFIGILLVLFVFGCDREGGRSGKLKKLQAPDQNAVQQTKLLLSEPVSLHRVEVTSEALATWRQYSEQKPTLLLFSNDPMLIPVPESLRADVVTLSIGKTVEAISERSTLRRPDPLFLPNMTVDTALRNGWFGQLFWALPMRDADSELSQEKFKQQLQESGIATEDELDSVTVNENRVNGMLRDIPFVAAALPDVPDIAGPVIVHFDQSYFQRRYKNEISTPIFSLIFETLKTLRDRKLQVLAATFAEGNLEGRIALDVRFVGEVLQRFIEQPELFDQPIPKTWKLKGDILYLNNFFKKEKTLEIALEMEKESPDSAWVKFTLYRAAAENGMGTAALGSLAEAVAIDKVYALEYLALSEMAYEKKRPDEALRMLKLAREAFPDNFQITLSLAQSMAERGESEEALRLVEPLQKLNWSKVYYPDMPEALAQFVAKIKADMDN